MAADKLTRNHRQMPNSLIGLITSIDVTEENQHELRNTAEKWIRLNAEVDPRGYYATEYFHPPTIKIQEFD